MSKKTIITSITLSILLLSGAAGYFLYQRYDKYLGFSNYKIEKSVNLENFNKVENNNNGFERYYNNETCFLYLVDKKEALFIRNMSVSDMTCGSPLRYENHLFFLKMENENGRWKASDRVLYYFNLETKKLEKIYDSDSDIQSYIFSSNKEKLLLMTKKQVYVFDFNNQEMAVEKSIELKEDFYADYYKESKHPPLWLIGYKKIIDFQIQDEKIYFEDYFEVDSGVYRYYVEIDANEKIIKDSVEKT